MIRIQLQKTLQSGQGKMKLDLNLEINQGDFITLYGISGAGKTSTLRLISGLLNPDEGIITVNGSEWVNSTKNINLSPQKRSIGYVFQDYALFPNMTVLENLEFALKKGQDRHIIDELITVTELEEFKHADPTLLSGGQQQRVALARALVQQPEILLLDEPLSALDTPIRKKLQDYILTVHKKYKLTTILVSHDKEEILKLSDVVYEIQGGKVIESNVFKDFLKTDKEKISAEIISLTQKGEYYKVEVKINNKSTFLLLDKHNFKNRTKDNRITLTIK